MSSPKSASPLVAMSVLLVVGSALLYPEAEGLVTSVPNRGTFVAGLTASEATEPYH